MFEQRDEGVRGPSQGKSKCKKGTEVTAQVGPRVSKGSWWQEWEGLSGEIRDVTRNQIRWGLEHRGKGFSFPSERC